MIDRTAFERGQPASLEDLGSGTALARRAAQLGMPTDGRRIVELVHAGDAAAVALWNELRDAVLIGAANLAYLFSPEAIVVGGGVGRNDDLLQSEIFEHLQNTGPPDLTAPTQVVTAELGDDAGLAGAAAWCRTTVRIGTGSVSTLGWKRDVRVLQTWNDRHHLQDA